MVRYIDVDLLDTSEIQLTTAFGTNFIDESDVMHWINEQPIANVKEIINCGGCKYFNVFRGLCDCKNGICQDSYVDKDDFCSYAEKIEEC